MSKPNDSRIKSNRDMAGPPGFEPGALPQERKLSRAFRVASRRFVIPQGKSITDADASDALPFQDPDSDLAELRALTVTTHTSFKSLVHSANSHSILSGPS
jgi:hypothetical protein